MSDALVHREADSVERRAVPPRGGRGRHAVEQILSDAGITVDGSSPWDIQVHDERFFRRVMTAGTLGFGETYVDGWWDCERLDEMTHRALRSGADDSLFDWRNTLFQWWTRLRNLQSTHRAKQVSVRHYDLSNDFFWQMLGQSMSYSCGYWRTARTLDEAQDAKMDLIARKLQLRRGDLVLDIGCGWGSMARVAAERYGCDVVGITLSENQYEWATRELKHTSAQIHLLDYRSHVLHRLGPFDKIVSVGMFEHVGRRNYAAFFDAVRSMLTDDGLFLLHSIVNDHSPVDPWLNKYIFPNGMLPSRLDIDKAVQRRFVIEDEQNIGADYDHTLMAWHDNVERYHTETEESLPVRFRRMWRYYLLTCAGSFRARTRNQVYQMVMSKRGMSGGYNSVR